MGYPLRVGWDLDGVWFDYVDNTRQIAKRIWPDRAAQFEKPATCWDYPVDDWDLTWEEFRYLNQLGIETGELFDGPFNPAWAEVLRECRDRGWTNHIVTHRSIPGAIAATDHWLRKHGIEVDSITFVEGKGFKGIVDVDVLVDDKHENVAEWVASGKHAILYNQKWNQGSNTGAHRAYNPLHVFVALKSVEGWIEADHAEIDAAASAMIDAEIDAILDDNETNNESVLQEAHRLVHGSRGADYGHPIHDFTRTGRIMGAILSEWAEETRGTAPIPPELVGLCMVGVKISREVNKPKRDNRVDGPGYFETVDMIHAYRAEYEGPRPDTEPVPSS